MSPFLWAAVGAAAGIAAALVLVRKGLVPALRTGGGAGADGAGGTGAGDPMRVRLAYDDLKLIRDDIQGLHVVRTDLQRVGGLLERLLEETVAFQRRLGPPRPEPGGPARDALPERVRDTPPAGGYPWQQGGRGPEREVQLGDPYGGFDPDPRPRAPAPGEPAWFAPAAALPREPSPDAVSVEASNDTVVPSERHPPEAWLERRGGEGEVWLNPAVALTDPALLRWSTFFDWERRAAGARYQAVRPAVVTSSGSVVSKGTARPL